MLSANVCLGEAPGEFFFDDGPKFFVVSDFEIDKNELDSGFLIGLEKDFLI